MATWQDVLSRIFIKSSDGRDAVTAVVDGLSTSQKRVSATATYSDTEILAVKVLLIGTGTLTLSPSNGATDIVITSAELTEMAGDKVFYGRYDSVTAGAGMELLAYID